MNKDNGGQDRPDSPPRGWELLHSKLPPAAIKELATSVYGVAGLSDVNEGFLIQRLWASGLTWEWRVIRETYLGFEDRTTREGKDYRVYMFSVHGALNIEGRDFHGVGASENRKLDAAAKGASTVAFKQACKPLGMTAELYLDGRAIDHIYSERVLKDQTMVPEQRIQAAVEWAERQAEGAPNSDKRQGSGEASDMRGATSVERPDGAVNSAPPQPTGELDMQVLFDLGRSLPKDPLTALEVQAMVAAKGYGGARTRLLLDHGRQCGKAPCDHVAVKAGLK